MHSSLVLELQRESINQDNKVSYLLGLALLVAKKLNLSDIINTFSQELYGYNTEAPIAPFRFLRGSLIAYDGKQEQKICLDKDHLIQYNLSRLSVPEIEELCKQNTNEYIYWPLDDKKREIELKKKVRDARISDISRLGFGNTTLEKECLELFTPDSSIYLKINRLSYLKILQVVRSIIQVWSLYLEEQGFTGEPFIITKENKLMAINNTYHISNMNGIIGDVINSSVNQNNIISFKNDESLLRESLKDNKVNSDDIDEIVNILINSEPPKDKNSFSIQIKEWIKKMIGKSLDGSWEIGIAAAGSTLSQIICRYYDIN